MQNTLIIYPAIFMIFLTLFLYTKNYLDNVKAKKIKVLNSVILKYIREKFLSMLQFQDKH